MPAPLGLRAQIVQWAKWGVANHTHFTYTEGPTRMANMHAAGKLPVTSDCSAWVTRCYCWAGAPDPNGLNYDGEGYTGTLLSHGKHIPLAQVQPGDVVVYGPGTGWHTAIIIEVHGSDVLTVSMGQQGDPSFVWVNAPKSAPQQGFAVDGRTPQTFLQFLPVDATPAPAPAPHAAAAPAKPATPPQVAFGARGMDVFKLQQMLSKHGEVLKIDGIFGPSTEQCVKAFQAAHHITADGVCGATTWAALGQP